MHLFADSLFELGAASVPYVWRPLVVWTLVALPLYLILHGWRNASPRVQYHTHLALLLALPLSFALMPLVPAFAPSAVAVVGETLVPPLPALESPIVEQPEVQPTTSIESLPLEVVVPDVVAPPLAIWTVTHGIGILTLLAFGVALVLLVRGAYLAFGLYRFSQTLKSVEDEGALRSLHAIQTAAAVAKPIRLCVAPTASTPMTFGWWHPVIVVPPILLDDPQALRVTLAHEVIHIRRHDYAIGWVVRLVCACFAVHPLVWLLRRRIDQYREISCDAETLITEPVGTRHYAELLLRFSPLTDLAGPTPLRMVTLDSTLKRRIQAMKQFARFATPQALRLHRRSLVIAVTLLLTIASLTACTIRNTENGAIVVTPPDESISTEVVTDAKEELARLDAQWERELEEAEMVDRRHELEKLVSMLQDQARELQAHSQAREQELTHELRAYEEALHSQQKAIVEQQRAMERELVEREVAVAEFHARQNHMGAEVKRLQLKVEYLEREIRRVSDEANHLREKGNNTKTPKAERNLLSRELQLKHQRLELLQALYMQHLEALETVKMEQYVRSQLQEKPVAQNVMGTLKKKLTRYGYEISHQDVKDGIGFDLTLPEDAVVELNLYDMQGNKVAHILDEAMQEGRHSFSWETADLPKGSYIYRVKAGSFEQAAKVLVQ